MASAWLAHVKKTMRSEASKKKSMGKKWFSHVLKTAKSSYKKSKHGGNDPAREERVRKMGTASTPPTVKEFKGGRTRRHSRR